MPTFNTVAERDAYYANKIAANGAAPAVNPQPSSVTYNQPAKTTGDGSWINSGKPAVVTQPTNTQTTTQTNQTQAQNPVVPTDTRTDAQKAAALAAQDKIDITAEAERGLVDTNKTAKEFGLAQGPATLSEVVAKQKAEAALAKTDLQRQLDAQKVQDDAASARFNEQAKGAIGATTAAYAQGREGAMAGGATNIRNEFTAETNKQIEENRLRLTEAQAQRDSLMTQLDQAQRDGETKLAESLSKSLSQAKQQIELNKTNYMNALTAANEQARLAEQSTQQAVTTFTGLVDKGTVMSPETIVSMANTLKIPFETAYGYYSGADAIRQDKSLTAQEKAIKLQDTAMDFQERIQGIRSEEAKSVADYTTLVKSGKYTADELSSFASSMKISSDNNPLYQLDLRIKTAQAKKDEFDAKYLGKEPPPNTKEWYDYKQAQLDLEKSQFELNDLKGVSNDAGVSGNVNVDNKTLSTILTPAGKSSYGHAAGKFECGEAYNRLTDGANVGDAYSSKMAIVTKRDNPAVGNALVIPLTAGGKLTYGHIETVAKVDGNNITTISYNRDLRGSKSIQTYNVSDLQKKYGSNWGFSDSKLRPEYASQLSVISTPSKPIGAAETTYNKFLEQAKANGLKTGKAAGNVAEKFAQEQTIKAMEAGEVKVLPPVYNWAGQVINNTFGDTEGGKKAARKIDELATAIENKDGKSAKSAVYNAVLEGVNATERAAFSEAVTLDDAYAKTQSAIADFKKAGLSTGLFGNTMSEIYGNLTLKRPDEARVLKTRLEQAFNAYRKAITGAGASMGELAKLEESVPTFNKNFDEIQVMTDMAQNDARGSLDRKTSEYSKGAFSSYADMQSRLGELQNIGQAEKAQEQVKSWLNTAAELISSHNESTGKRIVPEDHPIIQLDI